MAKEKMDKDLFEDDIFDEEFERGNRKGWIPVLIAILLILIVGGATVGVKLYDKYSYSREQMDLSEYYSITQEQAALIVGDEVVADKALQREGNYYLPLTFVQQNLNDKFYYDRHEKLLLFTTPTQLYEIPVNSASYVIAGETKEHAKPIWVQQDEVPYVELDFVLQFADVLCSVYEQPARIQMYLEAKTGQMATISKDTAVRYQGGIKSDILCDVKKGDLVYVLDEMETWSKVKTSDAVIGYVENKRLGDVRDEQIALPGTYVAPVYTSIVKEYPINLVWHQVTNATANAGVEELLASTKGITTISPTWFFLSDNSGNFDSIADQSYVDSMHAKGMEVWALIDNFTNEVDIAQILATTTNRKTLVNNLIQTTLSYQIDGINIDFEEVPQEAGEDYVQFLRELSISCRQNGIVLSVDNYVPTEYTAHYGRAAQGEVVDYFIIMGYDEHYGGSQQAGSVASYNYVKAGIENTLKDVPASKVINAVPFYTRLWKIADGVSSEAFTMSGADNVLAQNGVTATWDDETQQNFAEFEADGAKYQIWLEDMESMTAKLSLMSGYRLAGVAAWKLGLEKAEIWDAIEAYLATAFAGVQETGEAALEEEGGAQQDPVEIQVIETDE